MELFIMDPVELAPDREEIDLTPWISAQGVDWGEAAVEYFRSDAPGGVGQIPVDFRVPNRNGTAPLMLKDYDGTTFAEIRAKVQARAALWQARGGFIKRVTRAGRVGYVDVVGSSVRLSGGWAQAHIDVDNEGALSFEYLPDVYEDEEALDGMVSSTGEIVGVLQQGGRPAVIRGDFPLGNRCRIVVTDTSRIAQLGLVAALRSRYYSAAASAALAFEAESLTPLDAARSASSTGAINGNAVTHTDLATTWTPVLGTDIGGMTPLTHTGYYRVLARLSASTTNVRVRLRYGIGDLANPIEQSSWTPPSPGRYYLADLGAVMLQPTGLNIHRWRGQIEARSTSPGDDLSVDRILLVPYGEYMSKATTPPSAVAGAPLVNFVLRDGFTHAAGALTGKTLPVGGTWQGAGDADDFQASGVATVTRSARSDTGTGALPGRYVVASVTPPDSVLVQAELTASAVADHQQAILARYASATSHLYLRADAGASDVSLSLRKAVAGTLSGLSDQLSIPSAPGVFYGVRLVVLASGVWQIWAAVDQPYLTRYDLLAQGADADLAAGGVLASGKAGLMDLGGNLASTRTYRNFLAWAPNSQAVIQPSRSIELRTTGSVREDATGTSSSPVVCALPRLPSGSAELLVRTSTGDLDGVPDGVGGLRAQVLYRPCWSSVPGA